MSKVTEIRRTVKEKRKPATAKAKGKRRFHVGGLPEDCPVRPLGKNESDYYYIDAEGQFIGLKSKDHGRLPLLSLFGQKSDFLYNMWPRCNAEGDIVGWRPELAAEALMKAASELGVLDATERVRGPGCWTDESGALVYHAGDALYLDGKPSPVGDQGYYIYPAAPAKPKPIEGLSDTRLVDELLVLLRTWNWARPEVDPALLLGWIGAAILGGALDWRPLVWITGDKATGKSTLHKVLKGVLGSGGVIAASDASAAGLWQTVGHASLPITLDELEAEQDNRKGNNIIKLARHAASGGAVLRGGSDHRKSDFTVRSCFLFSSILIPPMLGQDISRLAVLQLQKLESHTAPALQPQRLAQIGAHLRRRLMEQWHRMPETLEAYRHALAEVGHGGRGADQFGTLLACYDLLVATSPPSSDELAEWQERLAKSSLAESEEDYADHERCVAHMLTKIVDVYRGGSRKTLGQWVSQAAGREPAQQAGEADEANKQLGTYGLKIAWKESQPWLQVANSHQGLQEVFRDTHWGGSAGTTAVWVQAFRRIDGARKGGCVRFAGVPAKCTEVPLEAVLPKENSSG